MEGAKAEQGSFMSDLGALLESADGADVTLVVGGSEYPAHSLILSARSPVFAAMLRSDMKEAHSRRIEITDMREDVLRQVLSFIYKDSVPELGSVAGELLAVADKYDLPLLKKRCEEKMVQEMNVENAGATAALAVMHRCPGLRDATVKFIASHPEVLDSEGWAQVMRENAEAAVEICRQLAGVLPRTPATKASGDRILTEDDRQYLGTLLLSAASRGQTSEVTALLGLGAPIDARDAWGDTALLKAVENCRDYTVKCLIDAGADVNARGQNLRTPLHRAAENSQGEHMVSMLLAASAHVDLQDIYAQTPLHLAAQHGHVCSTKALLLAGAKRNITNITGKTPLEVAATITKPLFNTYCH